MKNIKLVCDKNFVIFNYGATKESFCLNELDCVFRRGSDIFFIQGAQKTEFMPTVKVEVVKGYFKDLCKALGGSRRFVMCGEDTVLNTEKILDYSVAKNQKILTLCFESSNITCEFNSNEELKQAEDLISGFINCDQNKL